VSVAVTNDGTLPTKVEKILINGAEKAFEPEPGTDNAKIDVGETKVFVAQNLGTTDVGTPRSIVKITVVISRGTYETQLTVP
jgi:hypothetical protein